MDTNTFLKQLKEQGFSDDLLNAAPSMQYEGAADDLFEALAHQWIQNQSLEHFSQLLNQVLLLNMSDGARKDLVQQMNNLYLKYQNDLPDSLAGCYAELMFWDRCPMKKCIDYFDRVSEHFCDLLKSNPIIGPECSAIIKLENPSPAMTRLHKEILTILRDALRGRIATQVTPLARLETFLLHATGDCGYAIADDNFWDSVIQSCIETSKTEASAYTSQRQALIGAENGEISDHPKVVISRISKAIHSLDDALHYGKHLDPQSMLYYWRSLRFADIDDADLLSLYRRFLREYPQGSSKIVGDVKALQGANRHEASVNLSALLASSGEDINKIEGRDRRKGLSERKTFSSDRSGRKFIWISLGLVIILLIVVILLNSLSSDKTPKDKEEPSVSQKVEDSEQQSSDKKEESENSKTTEKTPKATEKDTQKSEKSPVPEKTEAPIETEIPFEAVPEEETEEEYPIDDSDLSEEGVFIPSVE